MDISDEERCSACLRNSPDCGEVPSHRQSPNWPLFSRLSLLSELRHLLIGLCGNFTSTMLPSNVDGGKVVKLA